MMKNEIQNLEVKQHLNQVAEEYLRGTIRSEHPEWVEQDGSCQKCDEYYDSLIDVVDIK